MAKLHEFEFELGIECYSKVSGFKGMITSRSQHLNGCDRYWIQPKVDKDGKMPDGLWFDDGELVVKKATKKIKRTNNDNGGFPSRVK